jgi:non-specific serine/threonine protein kinase
MARQSLADAEEAPRTNLPIPLASFVGRQREVAEIKRLLDPDGSGIRLMTLTGAGGCGKTRLAIVVAQDLVAVFPDGVWLVELAPLAEPVLVLHAVAATLGVREEPQRPLDRAVIAALWKKTTLLILDSCEHLIAACADVARLLLSGCPHLRILATSQEPLGIDGERTLRVPSLGLPDWQALPAARIDRVIALRETEAVRLFCERATAALATFELTPDSASMVATVCERLDGMPLAIELAAARVKLLGIEQIAARLDDRFRLLTGGSRAALPRHRTLRAAIEWSDALLSVAERALLRRLAVFTGGWSLEAAETICSDEGARYWVLGAGYLTPPLTPPAGENLPFAPQHQAPSIQNRAPILAEDVLDLLGSLVDKSLVQVAEQPREPRYFLLETVRQFAREGLDTTGETEVTWRQHASYFLARAEQTYSMLRGPHQRAWLNQLETDLDNYRASLGWALATEQSELALRLATGLDRFWHHHSHLTEGQRWLERGLASSAAVSPLVRARALGLAGSLSLFLDGPARAQPLLDESLTLLRALGSPVGTTDVVDSLGDTAYFAGDIAQALTLHQENLAARRGLGDRWGVAASLLSLGWVALDRGDAGQAEALLEESLTITRELQDKRGIALALGLLALVVMVQGDFRRALNYLAESLAIFHELGDETDIALHLSVLAAAAGGLGQTEKAARLLGAANALHESLGTSGVATVWSRHTDPHVRAAQARVDPATWAAAWASGRILAANLAIAEALEIARAVINTP